MGTLLATTAVIEAAAGLALLFLPSAAVDLLLGTPLAAPAAFIVARVAGAGLLTFGVACWLARSDTQSPAARGLIIAMVIYNVGVALILGTAGVRSLRDGLVLCPAAVVLDVVMAVWSVVNLRHFGVAKTLMSLHPKQSRYES